MRFKILILLFFIPSILVGQDINFICEAPAEVSVDRSFRITYTINENTDDINFPDFYPLQTLSGPNKSVSSSFSIINGKRSHTVSNSYVFYVKAVQEGKVNVKPATVKIKGKSYKSNSVDIKVVKDNVSSSGSPGNQNNSNSNRSSQINNQNSGSISSNDLYITGNVNKRSVYIGEPVVYSHNVYTKVDLAGFGDIKLPSYTGFWKEDVDIDAIRLEKTEVNGQAYYTDEILRNILFPQSEGDLTIQPTELEVIARLKKRGGVGGFDSFFDDFFSTYDNIKVNCKTKPQTIHVKPLPSKNKPADFAGAVGNYSISTRIDKNKLKANEAITYTLTIKGSGNIKMIEKIDIKFPVDFEVYEPNIKQNVKVGSYNVSGTKEFEFILIPRVAGDYKIESFNFSYFDPEKSKYITLKTPEFDISVEESDQPSVIAGGSGIQKEDLVTLGEDIRYISDKIPVFKKNNYLFFGSSLFYVILLFILLIFTICSIVLLLIRRKYKDKDALIRKKADKVAIKRLSKAKQLMTQGSDDEFYEEVSNALWQYVSDKFNIPNANLNRDYLMSLPDKNNKLTDIDIKNYISVIDDAEYVRFSPEKRPEYKSELYEKAAEAIKSFNTKVK